MADIVLNLTDETVTNTTSLSKMKNFQNKENLINIDVNSCDNHYDNIETTSNGNTKWYLTCDPDEKLMEQSINDKEKNNLEATSLSTMSPGNRHSWHPLNNDEDKIQRRTTKWYVHFEENLDDVDRVISSDDYISKEFQTVVNNVVDEDDINDDDDDDYNGGGGDDGRDGSHFNMNITSKFRFPSTTFKDHDDDNETSKCDLLSSNLINQMRAVSSPSLSENPLELVPQDKQQQQQQQIQQNPISSITQSQNIHHNNEEILNENYNITNTNHIGVLQKFKKTLTQFKNSGNNNLNNITSNINNKQISTTTGDGLISTSQTKIDDHLTELESTKYRFGPLIWRSSKERRKTKYNRRDKCNSGDSGIQIEIENDHEHGFYNDTHIECTESSPSTINRRVRRVNSAKASNSMTSCSSVKAKALKKIENYDHKITATPIPTRSLSQPSGLDRMTRIDIDESDTDSVSSHPDLYHEVHNRPIYAEVQYPFIPVGPQELALERGALVEIRRKEIGPWWYGRIKHDAVIENVIKTQQGWFPKDFVRIIQPPPNSSSLIIESTLSHQIKNKNHNDEDDDDDDEEIEIVEVEGIGITPTTSQQNTLEYNRKCDITRMTKSLQAKTSTLLNNDNIINNIGVEGGSVANVMLSTLSSSTSTTTATTAAAAATAMGKISSIVSSTSSSQQKHQHRQSNSENLRNSVIKELLETEINYVKLLSSLCLGYLKELRKRIDIFSTESLNLIFSNIESIWKFQQTFLDALRHGIETNRIAQVFLEHQSSFMVYSSYCNSYPRALMELESYSNSKDAKCILENCRITENLPELPLSAHLLAPIQRICRYPLHLAELVKHTPSSSSSSAAATTSQRQLNRQTTQSFENDEESITSSHDITGDTKETLEYALATMKKVTETVNEGKRHSENLTRFQASFENFQGPPIAFHSTRFFMQTDATRVSPNLWNNTYTIFLFDHQLIYCKKDILKRNHYIYKGRIFLDSCRILNLPDGKLFGVTLKNALRIYCESRNKWFDFCFRSASRKLRFLSTLAAERQFCGTNLFVSELATNNNNNGNCDDDDNLSDREYHSDYDTPTNICENFTNYNILLYDNDKMNENLLKQHQQKYNSDTLPKKSKRKTNKDDNNSYGYNTGSLGRRKIGNWFRKAKSTNTTPTQSPTHQHHTTAIGFISNSTEDSSSQSSPALGGGGGVSGSGAHSKNTTINKMKKTKDTTNIISSSS